VPHARRRLVFAALAALGGLAAGLALYLSGHDPAVRQALHTADPFPPAFWHTLTRLGEGHIQLMLCVLVSGVFYYRADFRRAFVWFMAGWLSLLVGAVGQVIKIILSRPRPKLDPLYDPQWFETAASLHSFPSGHTLTSFALVGLVGGIHPRAVWPLAVVAALVGLSRVFTGAHWPADVLAGAGLGLGLGWWLRARLLDRAVVNKPHDNPHA
jgi:membrane-associated phospholipid phosphatase